MNIRYVLQNELERKQCVECFGMWFRFQHGKQIGIYRLSPVEPGDCTICAPIDADIESKSIVSTERWMSIDEVKK